jgi:hypothetical protein
VIPDDRRDDPLAHPQTAGDSSDIETARLAAIGQMQLLQHVLVPADFAARAEQQVRQRARTLQREQGHLADVDHRSRPRRWMSTPQRIVTAAVSTLIGLVLTGTLVTYAAAQSLPGDWLYGLKQWSNQLALNQAQTPAAKAQIALQQLREALIDLQVEIRDHRSEGDIREALSIVSADTRAAEKLTAQISPGASAVTAQMHLAQGLTEEQNVLRQLLLQVDWPLRLALTTQLGTIGVAVPQITNVLVTKPTAGSIRLTIEGDDFLAGAQVIVDGQMLGAPPSMTATVMTITVPAAIWDGHDHMVGVQNPDGTATAIAVANVTPEPGNGKPAPEPSATPGNGHHGPLPTRTPPHSGGTGGSNG